MPPLPHLLDKIIAGSIIIQWLIHHDLVRRILEGISNATEFFERRFIATLHLAEVCVYDEETGVVSQKVRMKVHLPFPLLYCACSIDYSLCEVASNSPRRKEE